jgi:hypothetical protein
MHYFFAFLELSQAACCAHELQKIYSQIDVISFLKAVDQFSAGDQVCTNFYI